MPSAISSAFGVTADTAGYSSWMQLFQLAELCRVQIAQTSHAKYGELEKLYPAAVSAVTPKAGELADGVHVQRAGRAHSIQLYPLSHRGLTGDAWRRQVLWAAV